MFDALVALVLLLSAFVGFMRGGVRELAAVVTFVLAVALGFLSLGLTTPLVMQVVVTEWVAQAIAFLVVFFVVSIVFGLIAAQIARRIRDTELGWLDRAFGVAFGLLRAMVLLGLFNLAFVAMTPPERMPSWVTQASSYPLTVTAANALRALTPQIESLRPALERAVGDNGEASPQEGGDNAVEEGYDPGALQTLDDLVEKSL
jgi:membrane protein required for colicin V production